MITTRKQHVCHQCNEIIENGETAVAATAKEDNRHKRFHFHLDCSAKHARALRKNTGSVFGHFGVDKILENSDYPF